MISHASIKELVCSLPDKGFRDIGSFKHNMEAVLWLSQCKEVHSKKEGEKKEREEKETKSKFDGYLTIIKNEKGTKIGLTESGVKLKNIMTRQRSN